MFFVAANGIIQDDNKVEIKCNRQTQLLPAGWIWLELPALLY